MKIELWVIGKTNERYLEEGIALYDKRLRHYIPFEMLVWPDVKNPKNLSPDQLKQKEGEIILAKLRPEDGLLLLDERGKRFSSTEFAAYLDKQFQQSYRRLILLVGGAYGFSPEIYSRANALVSLSSMTFSHQMVRLFFVEQLYRAMTILRNEPYHNN